jgi:hypothetical protein
VVGLPFWFVVSPLHDFVRDRLGMADWVWLFEVMLVCIASFEVLRLLRRRHQPR